MKNKLIELTILLCFGTICLGQINKSLESGLLAKKTIRCISNPESIQEIIYEYTDGKLFRIINYSNTLLTGYEVIHYNQFGNEGKRIFYQSNGDIINSTFSTYDSKQRLAMQMPIALM